MDNDFIFYLEKIFNLNLSQDIIFIKDSKFNYIYANKPFLDLFNITLENILGKSDSFFMNDSIAYSLCRESDLKALKEGYIMASETVYNKTYEVLKFKININQYKFGIFCWAKG